VEESCTFDGENLFDIFVISDLHFYHRNIIEYSGRPLDWQERLIINWNNVVTNDDIVLSLGDFTFGNKEMTYDITKQLNGRIFNLQGNHDRRSVGWFDDVRVTLIKKPFMVECYDEGLRILFSHRPQQDIPPNTINISGHVHEKGEFIYEDGKGYIHCNVSVEQTDYKPIRLSSLMLQIEGLLLLNNVI